VNVENRGRTLDFGVEWRLAVLRSGFNSDTAIEALEFFEGSTQCDGCVFLF
jgi:hypothetical protein